MIRIEVDPETAKRIEESIEPIELCSSDGRQIGFFGPPISIDEIVEARRLSTLPSCGKPLKDVWIRILGRGEVE